MKNPKLSVSMFIVAMGFGIGSVCATTLTSVTPNLGDTYGEARIRLNGTGFTGATSVTIEGTACTGLVVSNDTIATCLTPAKTAGVYSVAITSPGGTGTLSSGFEAWSPTSIPNARVYQSDQGIFAPSIFCNFEQSFYMNNSTILGIDGWFTISGANAWVTPDSYSGLTNVLEGTKSVVVTGTYAQRAWYGLSNLIADGVTVTWLMRRQSYATPTELGAFYVSGDLDIGNTDSGIIMHGNQHFKTYAGNEGEVDTGVTYLTNKTYRMSMVFDFTAGTMKATAQNITDGGVEIDLGTHINGPTFTAFDVKTYGGIILREDAGYGTIFDDIQILGAGGGTPITTTYQPWTVATTNIGNNFIPRDGAQLLFLNNNLYLIGGWNPGQFGGRPTCNEVWRSVNGGKTWTKILNDNDNLNWQTGNRWRRRHMAGCVVHNNLLYVMGGDMLDTPPFNNTNGWPTYPTDVWSSPDGSSWTRKTTFAQWGPRTHHMAATFQGKLYVMGGQTNYDDPTTALNDVWMSSDGGANWTRTTTNAGWSPRCFSVNPVEFNGYLWLVGGGTYSDTQPRTLFNDVWRTADGTNWTQVLANGVAPWTARQYHNVVVFDNRLWLMSGFDGGNRRDVWSSTNGVDWVENKDGSTGADTPWTESHADGVAVGSTGGTNYIYHAAGNAMTKEAWRMRTEPGRYAPVAVSQWYDLGSGAFHLWQTSAASQPLLFTPSFDADHPQPGIMNYGTGFGGHYMIHEHEQGITNGGIQFFVVGRTSSTITNASLETYNPPSTLVGTVNDPDVGPQFGLQGGVLRYHDGSDGTWNKTTRGSGYNDGKCRLLWAQHAFHSLKLGAGTVQQGTTDTAIGWDTSYSGWETIGSGLGGFDQAKAFIYGAVVVIPGGNFISPATLTKLNKWAMKWGNVAP